jgi:hypothetical protein
MLRKSKSGKENMELEVVQDENQAPNLQRIGHKRKPKQTITHKIMQSHVCQKISPAKSDVLSPWAKNNSAIFDTIGHNQCSGKKLDFEESSPNKSSAGGNPTTPKKKRVGLESAEKAVQINVSFLDKPSVIPQQQK